MLHYADEPGRLLQCDSGEASFVIIWEGTIVLVNKLTVQGIS
jgi:hypothetical protein